MRVVLMLLAVAAVLAAGVPAYLVRARWRTRHPALALSLWCAAYLGGLGSLAASLVRALAVGLAQPGPAAGTDAHLQGPTSPYPQGPTSAVVFCWAGLVAVGALASLALTRGEPLTDDHRRTVALFTVLAGAAAYRTERRAGVEVSYVESDRPLAVSLPGRTPRVVVTSRLEDALTTGELRAVIEHERAHLARRHGWIARLARFNVSCTPALPGARQLDRSTRLLVELIADDVAARVCGRADLARALTAMAALTEDPGLLLRARRVAAPSGAAPGARRPMPARSAGSHPTGRRGPSGVGRRAGTHRRGGPPSGRGHVLMPVPAAPPAGSPPATDAEPAAPAPVSRARLAVAVGGLALVPAASAVTVLALGASRYAVIASDDPGRVTATTAAVGRGLAQVAAVVCVGALVVTVLLTPRRGRDRAVVEEFGTMSIVRGAALAWAGVAGALVLVDAADGNGQPLRRLLDPGGAILLTQGDRPRAWTVVLMCALVIVMTATFSRAWPAAAALLGVAAVGVLAVPLVEHVLVGPNHDFAGDATIVATPATTAWLGATVVLSLRRDRLSPGLVRRYTRLALVCWPVTVAGQVVVAAVETEGSPRLGTATGRLFAVQFVLLAALGLTGLRWWRAGDRSDPDRTERFLRAAALLGAGYLAVDVALTRIPPPQYFVPTSIAQGYLGYDVAAPPGPATLALGWRVNLLFVVLAVTAIGGYYLAGSRRLRGAAPWPRGRTAAWVLGWVVAAVTTCSGVGRYAGASFSVHMALHMSLTMVVPALLVLGAPVTLALRALPARPTSEPAGVREAVTALLAWGPVRHLSHPVHALVAYTASYYVLYFTDIFDRASRYHWAHVVMNLEFLAVGYLFFGLIMGTDPPPRPVPPLGRLGLVLAGMPFHAFFGVLLMTTHQVVAQTFYRYLQSEVSWITDLPHDQYVGGAVALAAGEVPLTFALVVLLVQWSRQDRRVDPSHDGPGATEPDAYRDLMAHLARRAAVGSEADITVPVPSTAGPAEPDPRQGAE
ncbi:MAG TPA: cytochrome c oxidase assembly protein [Kineosporiaceae bacterium]